MAGVANPAATPRLGPRGSGRTAVSAALTSRMASFDVNAVPVPPGGLAASALPRLDYSDAYAIEVPPAMAARALAAATFASAPPWVVALMAVRHVVVAPLGLVGTGRSLDRATRAANGTGERVGVFPVLAEAPDELLLGLNDRHLSFRVSVRILDDAGGRRGVVSTFVQLHNALGHVYFGVVKPFHRLVVPAMLRRAARRLGGRGAGTAAASDGR